jgi:hypothetical protein
VDNLPKGMSSPRLAECPLCGYSAGIYFAPKTERTASAPVRCLSCRGQAPLVRWLQSRTARLVRRVRRTRIHAD